MAWGPCLTTLCLCLCLWLCGCLGVVAVPCLDLALGAPAAQADTHAVDGISDQGLPTWDGGFEASPFAKLFANDWVASSHIRYARYVVQWNVTSGDYLAVLSLFEHWLRDVASLGLTPDVGFTSYDHVYPASSAEYAIRVKQLLDRARVIGYPVRYLEPWNEPNNQGHERAVAAAHLANAAHALCAEGYGCAVIAGDFEDGPGVARYEQEYERSLDYVPSAWGVHPYWSVEELSEKPYLDFLRNLPHEGLGEQVWITEIAARKCTDYNGHFKQYGEAGQRRRAEWLVDVLMRNHPPEHAFYYEFLLRERRQPSCAAEPEDEALYVPSGDPSAEDRPRAAAGVIWGGPRLPWEYGGPSYTEPLPPLWLRIPARAPYDPPLA